MRSERIEYFSDPLFFARSTRACERLYSPFGQEYKSVQTHVLPFFARSTRACERTYSRDRLSPTTLATSTAAANAVINIAVRSNNDKTIDYPTPLWRTARPRRAQHNKRSDAETARDNQPLFRGCWP